MVFFLSSDLLIDDHLDDVYRLYYEEFRQTLEKINFKGEVPTMLDLMVANLQGAPLDLMYAMLIMPTRIYNYRELDLESMMEGAEGFGDAYKALYNSEEYPKFLLKIFQRIEKTGVFEK